MFLLLLHDWQTPLDGTTRSKKKNFTPRPIRLSQNNLLKKYKVIHIVVSSGDIENAIKLKKEYA